MTQRYIMTWNIIRRMYDIEAIDMSQEESNKFIDALVSGRAWVNL
jgi:hypothetical protein